MTVKDLSVATANPQLQDARPSAAGSPTLSTLQLPLQDAEQLLGRVLAEFDGTTVLCRVCGDKASGFHYGVHSCEGCKGFFRRSIQQKIQYRPCTKNQQCSILRINRNRCQYCRLKKCIAVGMSRDAVRFGRVPKREKARILAAMQQSSNSRSHEKALAAELEDEQRLLTTVVRAHLDTCDFTHEKVAPLIHRAREQPCYTACPPTLACPLNPNTQPLAGQQELLQDFSKRFSPAIRGVVEFAKRIPGFSLLPQDDQVTLLKAGVFEVLLVRLACMFDSQTNSMICLNGQVLRRDAIHSSSNARFLMDSMFDFAERLNGLRLSDAEVGLFCAVVVIAPDRPGLRSTDLIERMQGKLRAALQAVVNQNHPGHPSACLELMKKVPDLRTLNTLHSEKLLAFKMTEQQQQQQQQQQMWGCEQDDSAASASPPASCSWSSGSDAAMDEAVKSPLGSVSSTESLCSGEVAALNSAPTPALEFSSQASSAPLLAATLAGCPLRPRPHSNEEDTARVMTHGVHLGHLAPPQHHHTPLQNHGRYAPPRRLESPSDSGIESGPDRERERCSAQPGSAPTSVCSSPRSSLEDKETEEKPQTAAGLGVTHVEDMPVLKRVLQAPPLYDTNSLMDEAYKPHKKFRALRNKDSAEAEAAPQPQPVPQPVPQPQAPAASTLSSTHSTLARSLMEGPRMTAEQRKRTDIIHSYIMRGEPASSPASDYPHSPPGFASRLAPPPATAGPSSSPSPAVYHHHHYHHIPQQPQRWSPNPSPGVITTTCPVRHSPSGVTHPPPPPPAYLMALTPPAPATETSSSPAPTEYPRLYFHGSPSTAGAPSPLQPHSSTSPTPVVRSPAPSPAPSTSTAPPSPPRVLALQVDCLTDAQQPLNLSKKSPSPSPAPSPVVPMEA